MVQNAERECRYPSTAVITGATSGFGRAVARALAERGTRLLLVGRSAERGAATVDEIAGRYPATEIEYLRADLSSLAEVAGVADAILERAPRLELLLNNAGGVGGLCRSDSVDGIESTLALNHFAYFQLTMRLMARLRDSAPARVVNVASDAYVYAGGRFDFEDPEARRRYRIHRQYGLSKLGNILFTRELAKRLSGTGVETVAWTPAGLTATRFAYGAHWLAPYAMKLAHPFSLATETAVLPLIELCCEPIEPMDLGRLCVGDRWQEVAVSNDEDARRLWGWSAQVTGVGA